MQLGSLRGRVIPWPYGGLVGCLLVCNGCSTLPPASNGPEPGLEAALATASVTSGVPVIPIGGPSAVAPTPPWVGPSTPRVGLSGRWELTALEALEYALRHHPALRARQYDLERARGKLVTAGLWPNPQLVVERETETSGAHRSELVAWATVAMPTGPKHRLRQAVAQTDIAVGQAQLARELKRVAAETMDAVIDDLYWQELGRLEGELRGLAAQAAEIQRERFKFGEVPFRDLVAAELAAADASLAERRAVTKLNLADLRLAETLGISSTDPPVLTGELIAVQVPSIPLERLLARARQVAPELSEAQRSLEASQQRLALARWGAAPDVTLGPRFRDALAGNSDRIGARLAIDLPLFDRNQGQIAAAAAQVESSRAALQAIEITTLSDVAAAYLELQDVHASLAYYAERILPFAEQTRGAIEEAFRDRAIGAYQLTELSQQFGRLRRAYVDLRCRHVRLQTHVEVVLACQLSTLATSFDPAAVSWTSAP